MPDLERITDQLRVDMAEGKSAYYWDGYRVGKSRARCEVVVVFAVICFGIATIGHFYT